MACGDTLDRGLDRNVGRVRGSGVLRSLVENPNIDSVVALFNDDDADGCICDDDDDDDAAADDDDGCGGFGRVDVLGTGVCASGGN